MDRQDLPAPAAQGLGQPHLQVARVMAALGSISASPTACLLRGHMWGENFELILHVYMPGSAAATSRTIWGHNYMGP